MVISFDGRRVLSASSCPPIHSLDPLGRDTNEQRLLLLLLFVYIFEMNLRQHSSGRVKMNEHTPDKLERLTQAGERARSNELTVGGRWSMVDASRQDETRHTKRQAAHNTSG